MVVGEKSRVGVTRVVGEGVGVESALAVPPGPPALSLFAVAVGRGGEGLEEGEGVPVPPTTPPPPLPPPPSAPPLGVSVGVALVGAVGVANVGEGEGVPPLPLAVPAPAVGVAPSTDPVGEKLSVCEGEGVGWALDEVLGEEEGD